MPEYSGFAVPSEGDVQVMDPSLGEHFSRFFQCFPAETLHIVLLAYTGNSLMTDPLKLSELLPL